ncbi:MAG: hypothetical protein ACYCTB_11415 [bacterium]
MIIMEKIKNFIKKHFWWSIIIGMEILLILSAIIIFHNLLMMTILALSIIGFEIFFFSLTLGIKELWHENPYIVITAIVAWFIISVIIATTNNTPGEITKDIIVHLTTIGALLFAFVPQGLTNINKNYLPNGTNLYDKDKLSEKIKDISYFLAIFVGAAIADILISPIFSEFLKVKKTINYVEVIKSIKESLRYDFFISNNLGLRIPALIYTVILIYAVAALILGFLELFSILKYFYDYKYRFNQLKSKSEYQTWDDCEIDWVIKNGLYSYFTDNKYEIKKTIEDFISKFDELNKPKQCKLKTFKAILKEYPDIIIKK